MCRTGASGFTPLIFVSSGRSPLEARRTSSRSDLPIGVRSSGSGRPAPDSGRASRKTLKIVAQPIFSLVRVDPVNDDATGDLLRGDDHDRVPAASGPALQVERRQRHDLVRVVDVPCRSGDEHAPAFAEEVVDRLISKPTIPYSSRTSALTRSVLMTTRPSAYSKFTGTAPGPRSDE